LMYLCLVFHGFEREQMPGFRAEATRLLKPHARLAIVEIHKRETPFGPPMEIRFSPEEMRSAVGLLAVETVEVGEDYYMQVFENGEAR
jgi:hypothetical protein